VSGFVTDQFLLLTVLCVCVALADTLSRHSVGKHVGGAIIVIAIVALLANLGVVPTATQAPPLYGQLLSVGAPVSIFLMLLDVHLAALKRAGGLMLTAFFLGAVGTIAGVFIAGWLTGIDQWLGEFSAPLMGMYTATYIGGGANFNAMALHYDLLQEGNLFAAATAVDNVVTVCWLAALLVIPRLIHRFMPHRQRADEGAGEAPAAAHEHVETTPGLRDLAVLLAMAFGAHWLSLQLSAWTASLGYSVPSILILTTLALIAAQFPMVRRLNGAQMLGTYGAYLFLAVIGAYCDIGALAGMGQLGLMLLLFVSLAVLIHGIVLFGGGLLLKQDPEVLAIASTANIGGSTTVLPMARSFGRMELLLPGILVGSLGNAVGTYLGFMVVRVLAS
jgi:uncharacterized membrane protein